MRGDRRRPRPLLKWSLARISGLPLRFVWRSQQNSGPGGGKGGVAAGKKKGKQIMRREERRIDGAGRLRRVRGRLRGFGFLRCYSRRVTLFLPPTLFLTTLGDPGWCGSGIGPSRFPVHVRRVLFFLNPRRTFGWRGAREEGHTKT